MLKPKSLQVWIVRFDHAFEWPDGSYTHVWVAEGNRDEVEAMANKIAVEHGTRVAAIA